MRLRILLCSLMALWALSACNLTNAPPTPRPTPTGDGSGTPSARPVVTITSPTTGTEVVTGSTVLVTANATDSTGVTRVQLIADGQVVKTVSSEAPTGETTKTVVLDYVPRQTGVVTLQVVAYRSNIASQPAEIAITVRSSQGQVTATALPEPGRPTLDPGDLTCRALTLTNVNFRTGPGTVYDRVQQTPVLSAGSVAPIIGRVGNNAWWQVRFNNLIGWLSGDPGLTSVLGNCANIPIVAVPPTPTALVTNTVPATWTLIPSWTPAPTVGRLPDLVVTRIDGPTTLTISPDLTPITSTFTATITNLGGQATGQFNNTMTVLQDGTTVSLGDVAGLAPGESILLSATLTFRGTGTFILQARADSDNQVNEESEANNTGQLTLVITVG